MTCFECGRDLQECICGSCACKTAIGSNYAVMPGYDALVEQVKKLLEVVEAPKFETGRKEVIRRERKQYFEAKKAIMEMIAS